MVDSLRQLSMIEIDRGFRRVPRHRVRFKIRGRSFVGWLHRCLDDARGGGRYVLAIGDDAVDFLDTTARGEARRFTEIIVGLKRQLGFNTVPTLKWIVMQTDKQPLFGELQVRTVTHQFGAVPAVLLGVVGQLQVAALPRRLGHEPRAAIRDDEQEIVMRSFDAFIPTLLTSYYEQIAACLLAVFCSSRKRAIELCRSVRHTVTASIRGKVAIITECTPERPQSFAVATLIRNNSGWLLAEAEAVDAFSHLVVNYLYRALNIQDRVDLYAERLASLTPSNNASERDLVSVLQGLARYIRGSEPDQLLEELEHPENDQWLRDFARVSRLMRELAQVFREQGDATLKIFLTRHFRVVGSDAFAAVITERFRRRTHGRAGLLTVQHLVDRVEEAILARVWCADVQVLFIPSSWKTAEGKLRLRVTEDWVIKEILYAKLIGKPLVVVRERGGSLVLEKFLDQLRRFPASAFLATVLGEGASGEGARKEVERAKSDLVRDIRNQSAITYDPGLGIDEHFVQRARETIFRPASCRRVEALFRSFRDSFDKRNWSVMHALRHVKAPPDQAIDVSTIVDDMDRRRGAPPFEWVDNRTRRQLQVSVKRTLDRLAEFSFQLGRSSYQPVIPVPRRSPRGGRPQVRFQNRVAEVYEAIAKHFHVRDRASHFENVIVPILGAMPGSGI